MEAQLNTTKDSLEVMALIVVAVFLILTSVGSSTLMFWGSLVAMFGLFLWYVANRRFWLATVTGFTFAITVVLTSSSLF